MTHRNKEMCMVFVSVYEQSHYIIVNSCVHSKGKKILLEKLMPNIFPASNETPGGTMSRQSQCLQY